MEKNTARLEAFSDGIFGVAITLLAIEIGIPLYQNPTNTSLFEHFKEKWPEYITFFNSFATVLLVWMGHRKIIDQLKNANHWIVLINGLVLLFVVFYPFPTRLVGTFWGTPAINSAVFLYIIFTAAITFTMLLLCLSINKNENQLVDKVNGRIWLKNMIKGQYIALFIYLIAAIVSIYQPYVSLAISFIMWIYWAAASKD